MLLRHLALSALFASVAATSAAQENRRIQPVHEPQRRALLIGNRSYKDVPLRNPVNDASDLASKLRELGFSVRLATDLTRSQMIEAAADFARTLESGDIGLFYYSGHGVQIDSENYLVPIDFVARNATQARAAALPFSDVKAAIERSPVQLSILILDSCRDNPFAKGPAASGMAPVEAGLGSYIAFAASPGQLASDNPAGRNGLFTTYLLKALARPLNIADLFREVRQEVYDASDHKQLPYIHDQVIADFFLRPALVSSAPGRPASAQTDGLFEKAKELYHQGRCEAAVKLLDQQVRRDPRNPYVHNAVGLGYLCLNMATPALEHFSRAIELKPDYAAAYWNRGQVFQYAGQFELAIDDFNWALEKEPENALLYYRRGRSLFSLRRYEDAARDFSEAIRLDPASPYGFHGRGQVLFQFGKYREARSDLDAAILRKSDLAAAYADRARVRERLGDPVGASADRLEAERRGGAR